MFLSIFWAIPTASLRRNLLSLPSKAISLLFCESSRLCLEICSVLSQSVDYSCHTDLVAVRYEYLTEILARHHLKEVGDPSHVKLVKHIIQKQDRSKAVVPLHYLILSEFQ